MMFLRFYDTNINSVEGEGTGILIFLKNWCGKRYLCFVNILQGLNILQASDQA